MYERIVSSSHELTSTLGAPYVANDRRIKRTVNNNKPKQAKKSQKKGKIICHYNIGNKGSAMTAAPKTLVNESGLVAERLFKRHPKTHTTLQSRKDRANTSDKDSWK